MKSVTLEGMTLSAAPFPLTLLQLAARQVQAQSLGEAQAVLRQAYAAPVPAPDSATCDQLMPLLDDLTVAGQLDRTLLPGTVGLLRQVRAHLLSRPALS